MSTRGRADTLRADLVAGLSTALVLVPQAMGYALLAGLPPVVGLHAATLSLGAYALLGTSAVLAVGPVALDSLLTSQALGSLGPLGPTELLAAAGLLALMVGALQVAMGALRLGHLANFLSLPVVTGFTAAAALLIAGTQLPTLLGLAGPAGASGLGLARAALDGRVSLHPTTALLGLGSAAALVLLGKLRPGWPRAPLVLVAATLLIAGLPGGATPLVGAVPLALPSPHLAVPSLERITALLPHAATLALIAFAEAFAVARRYASVGGEPEPSRELIALGAANAASALSGGYPITGGLSRSAVLVSSGARTRLAGVVTGVTVLSAALLLAPVLGRIPRAALAAVVVVSVTSLIDVATLRRILQVKRTDLAFVAIAFAGTAFLGFQWGLLAGVGASLAAFLFETTRPHVAVLGRLPGTHAWRNVRRYPEAQPVPRVVAVRIDAQLYFGNAAFLRETLDRSLREAPGATTLVLDMSGVNQLDSSAEATLTQVINRLQGEGVQTLMASVKGPVRDVLRRSGLWARLADGRLFLDVESAVAASGAASSAAPAAPAPLRTQLALAGSHAG